MIITVANTRYKITKQIEDSIPNPEYLAQIREIVTRAPLFATLPITAIEDLTQRATVRRVPTRHIVVSQGESGDSMFLIMAGRVKVAILGESGCEVTLSILRPGDGFGEMALFDGEVRSANCIASEPTTLLVLPREDLLRHLAGHPRTALNLLSEMARRLRHADESIAQLALYGINERLVHQLVSLAKEEGTKTPSGVLVRRPTQQELADMISSRRETVCRALKRLVRDGLIISRGRVMVVTRRLMEQTKTRRKK